ncbi:MAG: nuclear transport factor 2 family protein [Actinomycetota bacterium]|jgi:ketosteroid isomerase-like protein|nr:nuclear transport factor 2 family protein [Actinomycetota bacterium]
MALTVEDLLAKEEIRDVIYRYARGVDRLDFDLVAACYHPDAYDDHGTFRGSVPDFVEMCRSFLPRFVCTQHFMGNMLIEVDGDVARAETYAVAYHRKENDDGSGIDDVFGIRYVDRFEQHDGGPWLIAHRAVATEWRRVDPVPAGKLRGTVGEWGRRDGNDIIDRIMDATAPV